MEKRTAFPPVFWVANSIEVLERFVEGGGNTSGSLGSGLTHRCKISSALREQPRGKAAGSLPRSSNAPGSEPRYVLHTAGELPKSSGITQP